MPNGACTWQECSKLGENGRRKITPNLKFFEVINMFIINQSVFRQYNINSKWSIDLKVRAKIVQY